MYNISIIRNEVNKLGEYYVYEYIRLDTNEPFYVGKGKRGRWKDIKGRNKWFIKVVNKYDVAVNILHDNLEEQVALDFECWYIHEYKYVIGYDLVNIADGGESTALSGELNGMYGKKHSDETKKKISDSRKDKYFGENNHFYGKHHTEEARKKISEKAMGRVSPMKGKTGELASCYGREHTDDEKERIQLSQPTRKEIYCIELDKPFPSLSSAEKYMQETYNIVFSRRTLSDNLKKKEIVCYKEIVIDGVVTKLHWKYI